MKFKFLALVFLAYVCAAVAQPASFKGVPLGISAPEFFGSYKPGGTWAESKLAAEIFVSDKDYALIAVPPQEVKVAGFQAYQIHHKDSVAGVEAFTKFYFAIQDTQAFAALKREVSRDAARRALLQKVEATFENRDAEAVYGALVQRYGEPTRVDQRGVISVGRAQSTEVPYYVWQLVGAKIEFCKVAPPKGKPLFVMQSTVVKSFAAEAGASDL